LVAFTFLSLNEDEVKESLHFVCALIHLLVSVLLCAIQALILLHFETLHVDARLDHAEEVLAEVQEHHRRALHQLQVNHVVRIEFVDFAGTAAISRFICLARAVSAACSRLVTLGLALGLIRLFEDANVEAQELAD